MAAPAAITTLLHHTPAERRERVVEDGDAPGPRFETLEPRVLLSAAPVGTVAIEAEAATTTYLYQPGTYFGGQVGNSYTFDYTSSIHGSGEANLSIRLPDPALDPYRFYSRGAQYVHELTTPFGESQTWYYRIGQDQPLRIIGQLYEGGVADLDEYYTPFGETVLPQTLSSDELPFEELWFLTGNGYGGLVTHAIIGLEREMITTPLATFDALRVDFGIHYNQTEQSIITTESWWLARGLGIVAREGTITVDPVDGETRVETYRYEMASATSLVSNLAGLGAVNALEDIVVGDGGAKRVTWNEPDGTLATLSVKNGRVRTRFALTQTTLTGGRNGLDVRLTPAEETIFAREVGLETIEYLESSAATKTTIKATGGDGLVSVYSIVGTEAAGKLIAKPLVIDGLSTDPSDPSGVYLHIDPAGIALTDEGTFTDIRVHSVIHAADIVMLGDSADHGVTITAELVGVEPHPWRNNDVTIVQVGSGVRLLKANRWDSGLLRAPWAGKLQVTEFMGAILDLTAATAPRGRATLGSAKFGWVESPFTSTADWSIAGDAGKIAAIGIERVAIDIVGNARGVKVTGIKQATTPSFIDSWLTVGGALGSTKLGYVDRDNGGDPFGIRAGAFKSIAYIDVEDGKTTVKPTDLGVIPAIGDLVVEMV